MECLRADVEVTVEFSEPVVSIDNSKADLPDRFGDISANFKIKYLLDTSLITKTYGKKPERCLTLEGLKVRVGYDYDIRIDKNFKPGSCEYDAVMAHELDHKNAYESILADFRDRIEKTLQQAALTVAPVRPAGENTDKYMDRILSEIKNNPEWKLLLREIELESDIKNNHIDSGPDYMENCR